MSPEQAKGKPADKRADIWAFGCVLYEMLTGRRAFEGEDVSDTLAAILRGEPDWSALPATLPPSLRTLIQRSLVRNPAQRIGDIAVTKFLLEDLNAAPPSPAVIAQRSEQRSPSRSMWVLTGALALLAIAALAFAVYSRLPREEPRAIVGRFSIPLPSGQVFPPGARLLVAISRDGSQIAYAINSQVLLRRSRSHSQDYWQVTPGQASLSRSSLPMGSRWRFSPPSIARSSGSHSLAVRRQPFVHFPARRLA